MTVTVSSTLQSGVVLLITLGIIGFGCYICADAVGVDKMIPPIVSGIICTAFGYWLRGRVPLPWD